MHLSDKKARFLSERIARWLADRPDVELLDRPEAIVLAVHGALAAEMRQDQELEDEVEKILREYSGSIGVNMDLSVLRRKIKSELAKKKGVVL